MSLLNVIQGSFHLKIMLLRFFNQNKLYFQVQKILSLSCELIRNYEMPVSVEIYIWYKCFTFQNLLDKDVITITLKKS